MTELNSIDLSALEREARRLCRRYIDEVVLRFELCPWAEPALRGNHVQIFVITDHLSTESDEQSVAIRAVDALHTAAEDPSIELALIVFPRCSLDRLAFENFQRSVRAEATSRAGTGEAPFALAAFHPRAHADKRTPETLIPYLRRSPDPLLQAVRTRIVDRLDQAHGGGTGFVAPEQILSMVHGAAPADSLRLRVAKINLATLERVGHSDFERKFAELERDRSRTYAALGLEEARTPSGQEP